LFNTVSIAIHTGG